MNSLEPKPLDEDLIVKVSRMYYVSDISKKDIGDRLGISRFRVSRLLDQARQSGIVRIEIFEPISTYTEIEAQLEEKFGLQYAVVVQPPSQEEKDVMHAIGRVGAEHLVSLLGEGDVVGITWGATVNEVIKALPARVEVRIQVVQITGGLTSWPSTSTPSTWCAGSPRSTTLGAMSCSPRSSCNPKPPVTSFY